MTLEPTATSLADRKAPFYCGSQSVDWKCYNCDNCTKGYKDDKWLCELERKIDEAGMSDGKVDNATALRMGLPEDCRIYNWRCPEFVEAPPRPPPSYPAQNKPADWIVEWAAKQGHKLP